MNWVSLFQTILPYLTTKHAGDEEDIITFLIAVALAMRFWKTPDATKNIPLFQAAIDA